MKTFTATLILGLMLSRSGVSIAATAENSPVRDLAAAKSFAFGGVGVAGLMSEGERNLRTVLQQSGASRQLQAALAHATPAGELTFWLACAVVIVPRIKKSLVRSRFLTMTLKWRADV